MKARFDAGTDAAMFAAWDSTAGAEPFGSTDWKQATALLEADAKDGRIFLIHSGADGGGPVDVYIDEPIPGDITTDLTPVEGEFFLAIPSGSLTVDGAEYYRNPKPATTTANTAAVPPGNYSVRCYARTNTEDDEEPKSEAELARLVGKEEVEYYDRVNRRGCLGGLATLVLFPVLAFVIDWRIALGITIVVFVSYFHVRERIVKRNTRYTRLGDAITAYRLQHEPPILVLELRSLSDRASLHGGSVTLP